ncbi:hypothetical protein D9611_007920 [Ephemerocybe angulata]|uniref:Nephrocystin 3-like N-terminal domain-containing protein n=1 Tax=Ephemerocybe angulata TaxID=980116 RepID=A0A8H5FKP3_9AGAR|nr:hypothetical protein D9611_007920 [Tulosesus angulatus]
MHRNETLNTARCPPPSCIMPYVPPSPMASPDSQPDDGPTTRDGEATSSQAPNQQGNIDFFNAAQQLSIGTVTTTIVSGNCTYHVTVVNNNNYGNSPSTEGAEVPLEEIVAWLKGPKFLRIYEEALSQRLPNTGLWFIESAEFRQLVEGKNVIVWGTGMPGAGKTVISSFSFERLKEIFQDQEGVAIVGAYIRYTEKLPLRDIFAGLLTQLVEDHPCAFHYMRHLYIRKQREDLNAMEMVKALQHIVSMLLKVFLLVDGLDEADDLVRDELLQALPLLGANVLITSRPLDLYAHRIPNALHISIEARTEDIDHFVEEKVKSSSRLQAILSRKPALTNELKKRVRESSRGMFLVARLQMEGVTAKARSVSTLWDALKELPSGVDAMHQHTLKRINDQSPQDASIAHRVFIWMLYSTRDLSIHELQGALAVSFNNKTYDPDNVTPIPLILSMCGGFVTVEEKGQNAIDGSEVNQLDLHFRFIHYTTHEFLKNVQFPDIPSPHTYMAVTCVVYLKEHEKQSREGDAASSEGANSDSDGNSFPFLKYADQNWERLTDPLRSQGPLEHLRPPSLPPKDAKKRRAKSRSKSRPRSTSTASQHSGVDSPGRYASVGPHNHKHVDFNYPLSGHSSPSSDEGVPHAGQQGFRDEIHLQKSPGGKNRVPREVGVETPRTATAPFITGRGRGQSVSRSTEAPRRAFAVWGHDESDSAASDSDR